ncbi:MAG TPA: DUF2088 domain-containing protein [Methylomirabilota bacterium]|nr:DUF2088 domain-containing protein [Methylomirabilota bacterium]
MNPTLIHVTQRFPRPIVEDVSAVALAELSRVRKYFEGRSSIAIAVGSRGIANLAQIVRQSVRVLSSWGCSPFIVPAMGSHGGATAQGQAELLASYGITEESMGCPVRSSMEVVEIPTSLGFGVYMDALANAADGVLIINRIKPHTDFHGRYESGLVKMAVIGLGKERQAHQIHCYGTHGLRDLVPQAAHEILSRGKIVAGLAIVENAYDETAIIEAIPAQEIEGREPELLAVAKGNMPRLPVEDLDVLIVDELGKNISGTGMDTNIIGRIRIPTEREPESPRIRAIMVDSLTPESHGNATGMGLADVVTERLRAAIDWEATYTNIVTSGFADRGKLPVVRRTAREAYEFAVRTCGMVAPEKLRVVRIKNTLHLGECWVSASVAQELSAREEVLIGGEHPLFDDAGQLALAARG